MSLINELPPRHYGDVTVPARADGSPMLRTKSERDYASYVSWLADYLYSADIFLHPRQFEYAARTDNQDPGTASFWLSERFGSAVWELDSIDSWFADAGTWSDYDLHQRSIYAEFTNEECKGMTYEEFALTKDTWDRLCEEFLEMRAVPSMPDHADIPYRALLARILKRVPVREERIRIIDYYFENFTDNAAK